MDIFSICQQLKPKSITANGFAPARSRMARTPARLFPSISRRSSRCWQTFLKRSKQQSTNHTFKQICLVRGKLTISEPKTKAGNRTIILPPPMLGLLAEYKKGVFSEWAFPSRIKPENAGHAVPVKQESRPIREWILWWVGFCCLWANMWSRQKQVRLSRKNSHIFSGFLGIYAEIMWESILTAADCGGFLYIVALTKTKRKRSIR